MEDLEAAIDLRRACLALVGHRFHRDNCSLLAPALEKKMRELGGENIVRHIWMCSSRRDERVCGQRMSCARCHPKKDGERTNSRSKDPSVPDNHTHGVAVPWNSCNKLVDKFSSDCPTRDAWDSVGELSAANATDGDDPIWLETCSESYKMYDKDLCPLWL